jgi:hypothetical protein
MRTGADLREAVGSASDTSFEQILRILDADLKLLTPIVADRPLGGANGASPAAESLNYQLTHDYLVPSVREWLTTELRRTRAGQALLRLRERSDDWNRQPEPRRLPTLIEWMSIRRYLPRRSLTPAQRHMLNAADRRVLTRTGLLSTLIVLVSMAVWEARGRSQAHAIKNELLSAATSKVPAIAARIPPVGRWEAG